VGSSFGSASFPHDGRSYEMLLAAADRRMYEDKARRKRRSAASADSPAPRAKQTSVFAKIAPSSPSTRTH
jgi:predicted signal transduction protein with EAL and GGDEF domain